MMSVRKTFWEGLTVPLRLREVSDSNVNQAIWTELYVSWYHSDLPLPLLLFNQSLPIRMPFDTFPTLSQGRQGNRKQNKHQAIYPQTMAANSHLHITLTPPAHPKQKLNFEQFHASFCRAYKWQICSSLYIVHSPTNALFIKLWKVYIYMKIHITFAPTYFGLRPSSGGLYRAWLKLHFC